MPINTILITGCTRGLGAALAIRFAKKKCRVYAVGRDEETLKKLADQSCNIIPIQADITTQEGRNNIKNSIASNSLSIIHNAGIALPQRFDMLSQENVYQHFETHFFGPLFLTQQLMHLLPTQRVLMITSGAARMAITGLLPYCTSKAAFEHAITCLNQECNDRGIFFGKLTPGLMDTNMISHFCETNEDILPNRDFYRQTKQNKQLIATEKAADFVMWVLLKTTNTQFCETYWNISEYFK